MYVETTNVQCPNTHAVTGTHTDVHTPVDTQIIMFTHTHIGTPPLALHILICSNTQ